MLIKCWLDLFHQWRGLPLLWNKSVSCFDHWYVTLSLRTRLRRKLRHFKELMAHPSWSSSCWRGNRCIVGKFQGVWLLPWNQCATNDWWEETDQYWIRHHVDAHERQVFILRHALMDQIFTTFYQNAIRRSEVLRRSTSVQDMWTTSDSIRSMSATPWTGRTIFYKQAEGKHSWCQGHSCRLRPAEQALQPRWRDCHLLWQGLTEVPDPPECLFSVLEELPVEAANSQHIELWDSGLGPWS